MTSPEKSNPVVSQFDEGVVHITLDLPETRNALSVPLISELTRQFSALAGLPDARAVVLRGAGGHFCSGADLQELVGPEASQSSAARYHEMALRLLYAVRDAPVVVIAICEGSVQGDGLGLACAADLILAHRNTKFSVPDTGRGLTPAVSAPLMIERFGLPLARRLCLTGTQIDGVEASAIGLADDVFESEDSLQHRLSGLITGIMRCAPRANALSKHMLLGLAGDPSGTVAGETGSAYVAAARGPEAKESLDAAVQRRRPRWDYGSRGV